MSCVKTLNSSTLSGQTVLALLCKAAASLCFFVLWAAAHAATPSPIVDQCLREAAAYQGLPYELLLAIARVESSFNHSAYNKNKNATSDIGLMQINTAWLPEIKKYGVRRDSLWNPCVNAHVGAWILAQNIRRFGYTLEAVGAYNAGPQGNPMVKLQYAKKVLKYYHDYLRNGYSW